MIYSSVSVNLSCVHDYLRVCLALIGAKLLKKAPKMSDLPGNVSLTTSTFFLLETQTQDPLNTNNVF